MKKLLPALLLPAGAAFGFTAELYKYVFCRKGSKFFSALLDKKTHDEDYYEHRDTLAERLRTLPQQRFTIRSERGEKLTGHYFPCGGNGKRIAFIVHGYHSEYADTAGMYYDYYASRGFDVFACDHTAHGESEGKYVGFGVFECEDCLLWLSFLNKKFGKDAQILLHGFSMGAATVLQMSSRCPAQVRALVADCGYISGEAQLRGALGPLYPLMRSLNRLIAGYDLRHAEGKHYY